MYAWPNPKQLSQEQKSIKHFAFVKKRAKNMYDHLMPKSNINLFTKTRKQMS